MAVKIAILREGAPEERRVAATPETVKKFIALGAQLRTVLWMIVRESLILLVIGVGLGLPSALPNVELSPEVVLLLVLPPIIYSASVVKGISFTGMTTLLLLPIITMSLR